MKPLHIGLGGAAAVALFLLTPPETKASFGESWRRLAGDPGQACFDHERTSLNDPVSAKLQGQVVDPARPDEVTITLLAKNPFGAYLSTQAVCVMKAGTVHLLATKVRRNELALDAGIECFKDKIARRKLGQSVSAIKCLGE